MKFYYLTEAFYNDYKNCKEILIKENRPYVIFIVELYNKKFGIPFRTHINKNNRDCFITNQEINAGLDFQKAILIKDESYIDYTKQAQISNKDFSAVLFKDKIIKRKFMKFLNTYVNVYKRYKEDPSLKPLAFIQFSSLQYFADDLLDFKKHVPLETEK